ncbi:hypothetical protein PENANT_c025G04283 [Penicillium antarcticum]|uniref:Uncharacterized protein n=1 Tax=Penicillium antarcticum TaxID=416450 RepID=A0A1V6PXL2_9EURO|nr:pentalenene synthase [Penicillium antarcticum]KAJ5320058.1 pentalenene synthase [Penicillium antarcticum]OQD81740.1 hypothetical protein PENANT_c025G04283 [Penicillium antarcticum]
MTLCKEIPTLKPQYLKDIAPPYPYLLNEVAGWAFLFDDSFDLATVKPEEAAQTFDLYRNVTAGKQPEGEEPPLVAVWRRLLSRLDADSSENTRYRYREYWEWTNQATEREAQQRTNATFPELDEFIAGRRASGGCYQAFDWAEVAGGYELP